MSHRSRLAAALFAVALTACTTDPMLSRSSAAGALAFSTARGRTAAEDTTARREYGPAVKVGNGTARAYVAYAPSDGTPVEIGVALTEDAMHGLPAPSPHAAHAASNAHEHLDNHVYLLTLPARGAAPYQFVELDWNPGGHEPPGIYDRPHFDFHFWTTSPAERLTIVPSDPQFQRKADMLPPEAERPPQYIVAAPPGAPAPGVPLMGVHWVDVRSPELQEMLGKPEAYRPFTTTFLYGSWAGRFVFVEPMITRDYIISRRTATDAAVRDEVIEVPVAARYAPDGYYPRAYRIAWDAAAREYRIALTRLAWRE